MPKFNHREAVIATREILAKRFPKCFRSKLAADSKTPLKIGIRADVIARCPDIPNWLLRRAIADYTTGPKYTAGMKAGAWRLDLDGNPVTQVTEADQLNAEFRETKRRKKHAEYQRTRDTLKRVTAEVARDNAA